MNELTCNVGTRDILMEHSTLNPPALTPLHTSHESEPSLTLRGLTNAKLWARRRRRSLFVPQRCESDIGNAFLTHADFPKARANSLTSLNRDRKEEFEKQAAYKIIEQVINMELSFKSYDAKECAASSQKIAKLIKDKICNTFDLSGCKVICSCYVTKRAKPSLAIDSGCAWDELKSTVDKDAFVDYVYKNQNIVAVASVFVVHCGRSASAKTGIDMFQVPSTSIPKARSATFSESGRMRKDGSVFLPLPQRNEWMS